MPELDVLSPSWGRKKKMSRRKSANWVAAAVAFKILLTKTSKADDNTVNGIINPEKHAR